MDVLIIGSMLDPHILTVRAHLIASMSVEILDPTRARKVSIKENEKGGYEFLLDGMLLRPDTVIWNRNKLWLGSGLYSPNFLEDYRRAGDDEIENCLLGIQEWKHLINLLMALYPDQVINNPHIGSLATQKLLQQRVAKKVGFKVPKTLVTNNKRDLQDFASSYNSIILKSFSGAPTLPIRKNALEVTPAHCFATVRVTSDDIAVIQDGELDVFPHLFQQEIQKSYELRVAVIGKDVFAYQVDSQQKKYSEVDWRNGTDILQFKKVELPEKVMAMIGHFMEVSGAYYGQIDLIVDRRNEYWFLECNTEGQWLWLNRGAGGEIVDGSEISQSLAKMIASKSANLRDRRKKTTEESNITVV